MLPSRSFRSEATFPYKLTRWKIVVQSEDIKVIFNTAKRKVFNSPCAWVRGGEHPLHELLLENVENAFHALAIPLKVGENKRTG